MRTNPSRASDHTGLDYISPTTHPASDSEGFRAIRAAPQQLMNAEQDLFQAVAQARLAQVTNEFLKCNHVGYWGFSL